MRERLGRHRLWDKEIKYPSVLSGYLVALGSCLPTPWLRTQRSTACWTREIFMLQGRESLQMAVGMVGADSKSQPPPTLQLRAASFPTMSCR